MGGMAERQHAHADATYRVVPQNDTTFGVEVTVLETHPAMVTSFATETDAETWIADHKRRVKEHVTRTRWGRGKPAIG